MGGYGGSSGRTKDKSYRDTGGHKVKDKNAIQVAEYYIQHGKYVAFLQEKPPRKRADLSVEGTHVEVKGMSSPNPNKVASNIKEAFEQVGADNYLYPDEPMRKGKVIILSKYDSYEKAKEIVSEGFATAQRRGWVDGKVELWHRGKILELN